MSQGDAIFSTQRRDDGKEPPSQRPNAFHQELLDSGITLRDAGAVGIGAGCGLTTRALLEKSPVAFKTYAVIGSALALGVYETVSHGSDLVRALGLGDGAAPGALGEQARAEARANLLTGVGTAAELGAGFTLGALGGKFVANRVPELAALNTRLIPTVEQGARMLYSENYWLNKGGSVALGSDVLNQNGRVNLMRIADRFNQPWQGSEHIRAFDFARGRATTAFSGTEKWAQLPFDLKSDQLSLHFHPPGNITPTVEDFVHTNGLAMVRADNQMVLFKGWRSEYVDAAQKALVEGQAKTKPLTAINASQEYLHIDTANRTAEVRSKQWIDLGFKSGWTKPRVQSLDYQAVTEKLSDFDYQPDKFKDFLASLKPAASG